MLFPTLTFAIFFLIVFPLNWLLARRPLAWKLFMLAASYVFYGWWDWRFLWLLIAYTLVNYGAALGIARSRRPAGRRVWLAAAVVFDLGLLGFFKYYGFFTVSMYRLCGVLQLPCSLPLLDVVLPIGISFFAFQLMSYVVDVYRRDMPATVDLLDCAVFIAFFPQLVAGPIVRARQLLPQVTRLAARGPLDTGRAVCLILGGLFKKTVVANTLASVLVDPVFAQPAAYNALDVLLAIYGYAFQIYCDFSAYSDIAIGVGLLLGLELPLNFNAPYFATTLRDFWQRWHISLSTWLRDYLYIPLGGSRHGEWTTYRNLFLTFLLGGLWHGANWTFVFWGVMHGAYRSLERALEIGFGKLFGPRHPIYAWPWLDRLRRLALGVWLFHFVCLTWFFFRAQTFQDALTLLGRFRVWTAPQMPLMMLAVIAAGFATHFLDGWRLRRFWTALGRLHPVWQGLAAAAGLTIIQALGPQGVAPFIYFQF